MSNLKVLSDRLGYVGVSDLMKVFSTWDLLIGPADHPYLSPGRVSSKEYEMNVLELRHPDIHSTMLECAPLEMYHMPQILNRVIWFKGIPPTKLLAWSSV